MSVTTSYLSIEDSSGLVYKAYLYTNSSDCNQDAEPWQVKDKDDNIRYICLTTSTSTDNYKQHGTPLKIERDGAEYWVCTEAVNYYFLAFDITLPVGGSSAYDLVKQGWVNTNAEYITLSSSASWLSVNAHVNMPGDSSYASDTLSFSDNWYTYPNPFKSELGVSPVSRVASLTITAHYGDGTTESAIVNVTQPGAYDNYFYTNDIDCKTYFSEVEYRLDSDYIVTNAKVYDVSSVPSWCSYRWDADESLGEVVVLTLSAYNSAMGSVRTGQVTFNVEFENADGERSTASYNMNVSQGTEGGIVIEPF